MKQLPSSARQPRYTELPCAFSSSTRSLQAFLSEKTVIEFPTIDVVSDKDLPLFPRLISDLDPPPAKHAKVEPQDHPNEAKAIS